MRVKLTVQDKDTVTGELWMDNDPLPLPTVSSERFVTAMSSHGIVDSGLLPAAVRYISNSKNLIVFERPPMIMPLTYIPTKLEVTESYARKAQTYELPIPWTVYVVALDERCDPIHTNVYMRGSSITSMSDAVYALPLPNFYYDSSMCPPITNKYEDHPITLAHAVAETYNRVWDSGWNFDLIDAIKLSLSQKKPFGVDPGFGSHTAMVAPMFDQWASLDITEMLAQVNNYPIPSPSRSIGALGMGAGPPTLADVIEAVRQAAFGGTTKQRSFLVKIVNTMSALQD